MEELQALGLSQLVTVVGDQVIVGFDMKKLAEALHLGTKPHLDPSETVPLIERALEAFEQAVRQMPDEKLEWAISKRERSMRHFTYHVFWRVEVDLEELGTGVAPTRSDAHVRSHASFQDIADYGRTVIEHYRAWSSRQDLDALHRPSPARSKEAARTPAPDHYRNRDVPKSGAERLDLLASHTIQHLRQLYSILENFGITPENRVQDQEWPSVYVLTRLEVE
ncbi:MAG: DinB family protein [Deltaproteobacteria bacterium]|nr:DinB family protein [Deltaproteobacteria bacterium]